MKEKYIFDYAEGMQNLHDVLKGLTPLSSSRTKRSEEARATGQLWCPSVIDCGVSSPLLYNEHAPTWYLLLLDKYDDDLYTSVPVFPWVELADDGDLLLPKKFFGYPMAAAVSMICTVSREALGNYEGMYSDDLISYILSADTEEEAGSEGSAFKWGSSLLDEYDQRLHYHTWIAETLEALQTSVRSRIWDTEQHYNVIPFPLGRKGSRDSLQEYALAASTIDETKKLPRLTLKVVGKNLRIYINQSTDRKSVDFIVVDADENPSTELDGVHIKDADQNLSAAIDRGRARLPAGETDLQLQIVMPNGEVLDVMIADNDV